MEQPNNNQNRVNLLILIFASFGGLISMYLWHASVTASEVICNSGCESVLQGDYGKMFGVPLGAYGLAFYMVVIGMTLIRMKISDIFLDRMFGIIVFFGVLFTLYLRYLEFFVIGDICMWCWGSALMVAAIFILYLVDIRGRWDQLLGK